MTRWKFGSILRKPDPSVIAVQSIFFLEAFAFSSWLPHLPELKEMLHLSEGEVGAILLALPAGSLLGAPLAGVAGIWLSLRVLNLLSLSAMVLAISLIGLASHSVVLAVILALVGIFAGAVGVSMNSAGLTVEKLIGRPVLLRCHGFFSIGLAVGALLASITLSALSTFAHLSLVAVGVLLVAVLIYRWIPNSSSDDEQEGKRFSLPSGAMLIPALIAGGSMLAEGTTMDWSSIYLSTILDAPPTSVGLGVSAFSAAMALIRFTGDGVTMRLGESKVILYGASIGTIGYLIVSFSEERYLALAGFALIGLGLAPVMPTAFRIAAKLSAQLPGIGVAAVSTSATLGFLLGPVIVGLIAEFSGLRVSFGVIALLLGGVALLSRPINKHLC